MPEPLDAPEPCPGFAELISAGIDGALTPDEARALATHLGKCAVCRDHDGRLRRLVTLVRGATPLLPVAPEALEARLTALDARLARDSARTAPMPQPVPDAGDGAVEQAPSEHRIDWAATLRPAARLVVGLAFVGAAVLLLQWQWRAFVAWREQQKPPRQIVVVRPTATEASAPTPTEPPPPAPSTEPQAPAATDAPPPTTPTSDGAPVPPVAPDPWQDPRPQPPSSTDAAPAPGTEPTRERGPAGGAATEVAPPPALATRAQVEALLASILDRRTPPEQRLSQVASLGDPRFDQGPVYELLAAVVLQGRLDEFELANECRWAALEALGGLGGERSARVLLLALAAPPRDAQRDRDDAALCAALAALKDDAAVDLVARVLPRLANDEERALLVLRALGAQPRAAAVDGLLALYGVREGSLACLREAGAVLGATGDGRALPALLVAIEDGRGTAVRQGAALGLGALAARRPEHASRCLAALDHAVRARDLGLACASVRGLRATGAREAVPLLIARLDPADERRGPVRALALDALVAMTGQAHRTHRAWADWWAGAPALPVPGQPRALPDAVADVLAFYQLPSYAEGVVFVLDVSGSMAGGTWAQARAELDRALDEMPPHVRFELLFMRDAAVPVFGELQAATPANVERARRAIERQRPIAVAQTQIGKTLERALSHHDADTIYFVSDGVDSRQDADALRLRIARVNARRAVPARIHAILAAPGGALAIDDRPGGPDDPPPVRLMRGLARDSGGVFVRTGW